MVLKSVEQNGIEKEEFLFIPRADIDYGVSRANTTYGICGVKVWIFKGEKFDKDVNEVQKDKPSNDGLNKAEE